MITTRAANMKTAHTAIALTTSGGIEPMAYCMVSQVSSRPRTYAEAVFSKSVLTNRSRPRKKLTTAID